MIWDANQNAIYRRRYGGTIVDNAHCRPSIGLIHDTDGKFCAHIRSRRIETLSLDYLIAIKVAIGGGKGRTTAKCQTQIIQTAILLNEREL